MLSAGIATGRSGDPIPVDAALSAPIQTGPGTHLAPYTTCNWSHSQGVKEWGRCVDHTLQSSSEVKERVLPYLYSHFEPSWPALGWTSRPLYNSCSQPVGLESLFHEFTHLHSNSQTVPGFLSYPRRQEPGMFLMLFLLWWTKCEFIHSGHRVHNSPLTHSFSAVT